MATEMECVCDSTHMSYQQYLGIELKRLNLSLNIFTI